MQIIAPRKFQHAKPVHKQTLGSDETMCTFTDKLSFSKWEEQ